MLPYRGWALYSLIRNKQLSIYLCIYLSIYLSFFRSFLTIIIHYSLFLSFFLSFFLSLFLNHLHLYASPTSRLLVISGARVNILVKIPYFFPILKKGEAYFFPVFRGIFTEKLSMFQVYFTVLTLFDFSSVRLRNSRRPRWKNLWKQYYDSWWRTTWWANLIRVDRGSWGRGVRRTRERGNW